MKRVTILFLLAALCLALFGCTSQPSMGEISSDKFSRCAITSNYSMAETDLGFYSLFGRLSDGTIVLADEISPDTCRLWDCKTHEKLDKDRFRRDLGGVEDAYAEIMKRLLDHDAQ